MTPKKLREIADALEQGKEIQCLTIDDRWICSECFCGTSELALHDDDYRVKPEPVELWVTKFKDGTWGQALTRKDNSESPVDKNYATRVLFREVI